MHSAVALCLLPCQPSLPVAYTLSSPYACCRANHLCRWRALCRVALCLLPSDHLYESKVPEIREPSVRYIAKPTAGEAERCYTVRRRWTAHLQFVKVKFGIHLKFNFDFDIDMYGCCHDNGGISSYADVLYTS